MANKRILQISPCILLTNNKKDAVFVLGWVSVQTITTDGNTMIENESYSIFNYKNPILTFESGKFVIRDIDKQRTQEMNSHWGDILWINNIFYDTWLKFSLFVAGLNITALDSVLNVSNFIKDKESANKNKTNNGNHYGQFK